MKNLKKCWLLTVTEDEKTAPFKHTSNNVTLAATGYDVCSAAQKIANRFGFEFWSFKIEKEMYLV